MREITLSKYKTVTIYVLTEPDGETVRYVGQSEDPEARLRSHITVARCPVYWNGAKNLWIARLQELNQIPRMFELEVVKKPDADQAEKKWIRHYNINGRRTFNGVRITVSHYDFGFNLADVLAEELASWPSTALAPPLVG